MLLLAQHAAEAAALIDVRVGEPIRVGDRFGQRCEWSGVGDALVRPVFVGGDIELAQWGAAEVEVFRSAYGRAARVGRSAATAPVPRSCEGICTPLRTTVLPAGAISGSAGLPHPVGGCCGVGMRDDAPSGVGTGVHRDVCVPVSRA
jgi:hypothetical protein